MTAQQRHWILCGGLASGKSTVRRILEASGVATIDSDQIGHEVIAPGGPAFDAVGERWPSVVRQGEIDRAALGAIVFGDSTELRALEAMTHPHIFDTIESRAEEIEGQVVVELPLPPQRLGDDWLTMVVDVGDELRVKRAVARGMDIADMEARLANQPRRDEWLAMADLVIPNHGGVEELTDTVAVVRGIL